MTSSEYRQFIANRAAIYRRIMTERKLKEKPAIDALCAGLDVLNEQFAETLARSVDHNRRSFYILAL